MAAITTATWEQAIIMADPFTIIAVGQHGRNIPAWKKTLIIISVKRFLIQATIRAEQLIIQTAIIRLMRKLKNLRSARLLHILAMEPKPQRPRLGPEILFTVNLELIRPEPEQLGLQAMILMEN